MMSLHVMIVELSRRADEIDLIALLATSREAQRYNADLARELRDIVWTLGHELDRRHREAESSQSRTVPQALAG